MAGQGKLSQFLNRTSTPGHITNKRKFHLSLPGLPVALSNSLIHMAYIKFYTDIIGLDARYVGILYMVFGIWNAINDPMMGVFIDRIRYTKKRGKYTYLMRVTTPITVLSSLMMLFSSPKWEDWLIFAVMLFLLFIFDTTQTLYSISYASYILIAAPTKGERVDVAVVSTYIGHAGAFLGSIIPTMLLVGESNRSLTITLFCAVLLLNSILYFFALKPLKDDEEMYKRESATEEGTFARDLKQNVKNAFQSRAFITYVLYHIVGRGPTTTVFTIFLFMMDYVLNISGGMATLIDVVPGLTLFLFLPLFGKFSKRHGLIKTAIYATVPLALGFISLYFVQNWWQALLAYITMAVFGGMGGLIHGPMMGAIIDEDEQRTGTRKTGLYNGLMALLTIPISGLYTIVFTWIISAFTFVSGAEVQTARAIQGIRFGASVVPFVFVLLGLIPLFMSPIDLKKEQELSEFSEERHREAHGTAEPIPIGE